MGGDQGSVSAVAFQHCVTYLGVESRGGGVILGGGGVGGCKSRGLILGGGKSYGGGVGGGVKRRGESRGE